MHDQKTAEDGTVRISEDSAEVDFEQDIPPCECGRYGHVAAFAVPRAIIERAKLKGLADERLDKIDELAARPRAETELGDLFLQGGAALGRTIAAAINWINPEQVIIYLPTALYEANPYLAGSFYLAGLNYDIEMSTFSPGRRTCIRCIVSSDAEMEDRLAAAAAYLVFERLAEETEEAERKSRVDGSGNGRTLTSTCQEVERFSLIRGEVHRHRGTLPNSINVAH
jgi:predicted NBD/HSP70 family sugar kinase